MVPNALSIFIPHSLMNHSHIRVHVIWGTKYRRPCLTSGLRLMLFSHMKENAQHKGIFIDTINGYFDHVHCLLGLGDHLPIAKAVQLLKGESAYWVNKQGLLTPKLCWAAGYYAVLVSRSELPIVREYILHQERHHRIVSYQEEYRRLLTQCRNPA